MARRPRRRTALSFGFTALVAIAVSCRDATQLEVRVVSREACSDISAVQIVVGTSPTETQQRFIDHFTSAATHECGGAGLVGTLTLVPGGPGGTVLVAAGVKGVGLPAPDPTTCADPEVAKRCIVARRRFSFIDHTSLRLPIELDPLCVGRVCDASSTCFRGACVDATIVCNGSDCGLPLENPGGGGVGGATEAGSTDGRYDDALDGSVLDVIEDGRDASPDVVGGPDANDSGSNKYPACASGSGLSQCTSPPQVFTPGNCDGSSNAGVHCCHCTCSNSVERSCPASTAANYCVLMCP